MASCAMLHSWERGSSSNKIGSNRVFNKSVSVLFLTGDGHLWFSVYTRPPNSSFTRVQRLTCCISLLFSSMVANAMFYELADAKENLRIKFGPIDFTWRELMIGVQSSLIVVPVNLLIITVFRYTAPKKSYVDESIVKDGKAASPPKSKGGSEVSNTKSIDKKSKEAAKAKTENKSKGKKDQVDPKSKGKKSSNDYNSPGSEETPKPNQKKKKFKLPHWFNYIAYTLALLTSLTGATFTMFYSMIWGKEKSNKWITSVIVSLVQDIFFLQPLKVVLVASILAILFRKPPEEERDEVEKDEAAEMTKDELEKATPGEDKMKNPKEMKSLHGRPDPILVALAREKKLNEVKMFKVFSQLGLQLFFVFLLSIASYGTRSNDRYYLSKNIKDIFNTKLDKVRNSEKGLSPV